MTEGPKEGDAPSPARTDAGPRKPTAFRSAARSDLEDEDAAKKAYLALCSDYLKRQLIVYENWPQYRLTESGYTAQKVFRDQNT